MKNIIKLLPILFLFVFCEKEYEQEEPNRYTLHVSVIPHGSGIVSPLGGYFEEGTSFEITITPKQGYVFKEYKGDVTGTTIPLNVTMNSQKTITVVFEGIDTDGDGVLDIDDNCPNTSTGEVVNDIGCSASQKNYVPDDNFEQKLIELGYDDILDGYVPDDKIGKIEELNISNSNISDLTGIENFTNLRVLNCSNNSLTNLDISNNNTLTNIDCSGNQLMSLNLSNNTSLTNINCSNNPITDIDLSNNINIDTLICRNNSLTSLDISDNTSLVYLNCSDNGIKSLDVNNKDSLVELWCARNGMTSLDITNCKSLSILYCNANKLITADVSTNTSLNVLWCAINEINSLDVSTNTSLSELVCTFNQLSCIKVNQSQLDNIPAGWEKDSSAKWSIDCN